MLEQKTIDKICEEYGIGDFISIEQILEGKLNDNYVLKTAQGKYFIKSVREGSKDKLRMINGVESLMKSHGVPAVAMLQTKTGEIFVPSEDKVCTLYPFIENKKAELTIEDYFSIGEMLGKIHVAGKEELPKTFEIEQFKKKSVEKTVEKLKKYQSDIKNKETKNETDNLLLKFIEFKLSILPKVGDVILPNNNLNHGDYHPGNVLFDENRKIIGVIDWEKTQYAPRTYELARSFLYTCYTDGYNSETVLDFSKSFFAGYLSQMPTDTNEIIDGLKMRIHSMAISSWIEMGYYDRGDTRSISLIPHEMELIDLVVNRNLLQQVEDILQ